MGVDDERLLRDQLIAQRIAQGFRDYLLKTFIVGEGALRGTYDAETKDGTTTITFSMHPDLQAVPFSDINFRMEFKHR